MPAQNTDGPLRSSWQRPTGGATAAAAVLHSSVTHRVQQYLVIDSIEGNPLIKKSWCEALTASNYHSKK